MKRILLVAAMLVGVVALMSGCDDDHRHGYRGHGPQYYHGGHYGHGHRGHYR